MAILYLCIDNDDFLKNDNNTMETSKQPKPNSKGRRHLKPTIALEQQLSKQIYNALQGSVVEAVLKKIKTSGADTYWRSSMEGHSLKVQEDLLPDFYRLCHEVKDKLHFDEPVDFYITGDSSVNAFSVAAEDEGEPNIVNVNSALFDLMTEDELRFVIGHELGHLINKDTKLARLIQFVFPPEAGIPVSLQYKIRLHDQLAELVADRYGYMATDNLGVCVTAFFKLASGLDLVKMNVSLDALIADNNRRLDYFLKDKGISRATHPVNPVRVQALNLFSTMPTQKELNEGMDELISILLKVGNSELDEYTAQFVVSAGIIVANIDKALNLEEYHAIIENLADLKIFPRKFIEEVMSGDIVKTFNESVEKILQVNPGMREDMLEYMIQIVISDKTISNEEMNMLYDFGRNVGLSDMEVATSIALAIQKNYIPSMESIS